MPRDGRHRAAHSLTQKPARPHRLGAARVWTCFVFLVFHLGGWTGHMSMIIGRLSFPFDSSLEDSSPDAWFPEGSWSSENSSPKGVHGTRMATSLSSSPLSLLTFLGLRLLPLSLSLNALTEIAKMPFKCKFKMHNNQCSNTVHKLGGMQTERNY